MDSILNFKLVYSHKYGETPIPNGLHPIVVDKIKNEYNKDSHFNLNFIYNIYDGNVPFFHCNFSYFFDRFHNHTDGLKIHIDDVDENDSTIIYLYPIEIKTTLSSLYNKLCFKLDEVYYEYNFIDTLSDKELNLLRNKKMLLLISLIHDPLHYPDDILKFDKVLSDKGISSDVCHYILSNKYDGHKKHGSMAETYHEIIPLNQYSNWLVSTMAAIEHGKQEYCIGGLGYYNKFVIPTDINNTKKRSKKFLCFNRTPRPHRIILLYLAIKNNWLENGLFSFIFPFYENSIGSMESVKNTIFSTYPEELNLDYYTKKICEMLPYELDTQQLPSNQKNGFQSNNNNIDFYLDTYLHIVSETSFFVGNDCPTLTEKTFRPICNLQPFIQIGDAHSLKLLKNLGFKTFEPYINESYDEEIDPRERMNLIEKELNRINSMTDEEIHEWYHSMMDILIYNQEHMKTFINHNPIQHTLETIKANWR